MLTGHPVPYCVVEFKKHSYDCLQNVKERILVSELIAAGKKLRKIEALVFPQPGMPALNGLVDIIAVRDADGLGTPWWPTHMQSGPVAPMDDAINNAITRKRQSAKHYDWKGSSERWLLLVAEGRGLADVIGRPRRVHLPSRARSPFTLVLVWDKFSGDVWSVLPRFATICTGFKQRRYVDALPEPIRSFARPSSNYQVRSRSRRPRPS